MSTYEIEYTTNLEDRLTVCLQGSSKTEVYLRFAMAHPIEFIITDIKEI